MKNTAKIKFSKINFNKKMLDQIVRLYFLSVGNPNTKIFPAHLINNVRERDSIEEMFHLTKNKFKANSIDKLRFFGLINIVGDEQYEITEDGKAFMEKGHRIPTVIQTTSTKFFYGWSEKKSESQGVDVRLKNLNYFALEFKYNFSDVKF